MRAFRYNQQFKDFWRILKIAGTTELDRLKYSMSNSLKS